MKVYIVFQGTHYGESVKGVFLNEFAAEEIKEYMCEFGEDGSYYIEEHEVET
jgi:hypothetical protein